MKRLTVSRIRERAGHAAGIRRAIAEVNTRIEAYNRVVREAADDVAAALSDLNEQIEQTISWRDEIVGEMNQYLDDRSDRWRESDAGQNYADWIREFEELEIEAIDLTFPDALEELPGDLPDVVESLPDAPSQ